MSSPTLIRTSWRLICLFMLAAASPRSVAAIASAVEEPVASADIEVGMSTALSGTAGDLGTGMRVGVEAAFASWNANPGRSLSGTLVLKVLDDGYEPSRTAPNVRELITTHKVSAILGNVGTPTAVVAIPIASEAKIPFIGAFTGAAVLRPQPPNRYVINYRASYAEECAAMVDALVELGGLKPTDIAMFTQRDAYGDDGYNSAVAAMKRHGLTNENDILHGRYERNSLAVEHALADLISGGEAPRAVIMVGTAMPCAKFIRLAREYGLESRFLSVSFVGTAKLASELGSAGDGVIITQVVPHYNADLPIIKAFQAALPAEAAGFREDYCALEGFIAANMFLHALDRVRGPVTPERIIEAMEGLGSFDLGLGQALELSPQRHQACSSVWPTVLRAGKPQAMKWEDIKTLP